MTWRGWSVARSFQHSPSWALPTSCCFPWTTSSSGETSSPPEEPHHTDLPRLDDRYLSSQSDGAHVGVGSDGQPRGVHAHAASAHRERREVAAHRPGLPAGRGAGQSGAVDGEGAGGDGDPDGQPDGVVLCWLPVVAALPSWTETVAGIHGSGGPQCETLLLPHTSPHLSPPTH